MGVFSRHRTVETVGTSKNPQLISDEALDIAVASTFRKSLACQIAAMIRAVDAKKPVLIAPLPYPTHGYVRNERKTFWRDAETLAPRLEPAIDAAVEGVEREFGVVYLRQPEATIDRRFFTREEFSQGSIRLRKDFDVSHPQEEHRHMNAAYGQAVLEVALPLIGIDPRSGARPARASAAG